MLRLRLEIFFREYVSVKVFISWSGDVSREIAETLRKYLPLMLQGVTFFMSKHDLGSGVRWAHELSGELADSSFGILCLTPENVDSSWIIFEAGALTKHIEGRACCLLFGGLTAANITGPLAQFQNRLFSEDEFRQLLLDINAKMERPIEGAGMETIFRKFWPDLQNDVERNAKKKGDRSAVPVRSEKDLLEEILLRVRAVETQVTVDQNNKWADNDLRNLNRTLMRRRDTLGRDTVKISADLEIAQIITELAQNAGGVDAQTIAKYPLWALQHLRGLGLVESTQTGALRLSARGRELYGAEIKEIEKSNV